MGTVPCWASEQLLALPPDTALKDEMTLPQQDLRSTIPDLRNLPLDRIAELGDSVLAQSIALYQQRLKDNGVPLSSFNSGI